MTDSIALALQYKKEHPQATTRQVSDACNVPKSTLHDRMTGLHSSHQSAAKRHLSIEQEEQLVLKIEEYASRGTLLTPRHVKELAESVCGLDLGVNWGSRFIKRHEGSLCSHYYTYKELARLQADTPSTRKAFYNLVRSVYDTGLYTPSNIYNMDESGFELASARKVRRVAPKGHPRNGQAVPASSEHITSVATIGIDSAPVPPLIIFQGVHLQENWFSKHQKDVPQLAFVTNSGWMNSYVVTTP